MDGKYKFEQITLIFENCDSVYFDGDEIRLMQLEEGNKLYNVVNKEMVARTECLYLLLHLPGDANKEYSPFKSDKFDKIYKFDRIRQEPDICQIEIKYSKRVGESETVLKSQHLYIYYKEDEGGNKNQVSQLDGEDLYLFIDMRDN